MAIGSFSGSVEPVLFKAQPYLVDTHTVPHLRQDTNAQGITGQGPLRTNLIEGIPVQAIEVGDVLCLHIDIEEAVPLEADPGQDIVEQSHFCDVKVLGVLVHEIHSEIEEHVGHCSTGFIVGISMRK